MKRLFFSCIIAIMFLAGLQLFTSEVFARESLEHVVKAAMIRNFALFTRWPQNSGAGQAEDTLTVCLMGDESLLESFTGIRGKQVSGRSIELRWVENISGLQGCDLLFIDKSSRTEITRIMDSLRDKPVLTIGETGKFTRAGGIITFYMKNEKIRFLINPGAARRAGLQLSSNLLELATIVETPAGRQDR